MKTIIGSGILGLPYVLSQFGCVFGVIILIIFGIETQFSCYLLLRCKNLSHHSNYCTIGPKCIGKHSKYIINLIFILNNLGVCIIELVIFATSANLILTKAFNIDSNDWYTDTRFLIVCMLAIVLPFCYISSLERLKFVSLFAIASITFFSFMTVYNFANSYTKNKSL